MEGVGGDEATTGGARALLLLALLVENRENDRFGFPTFDIV